jgi:hypothetical protein
VITTIREILEPHTESIKNCEGIFYPNFLDLDYQIPSLDGFSLWLDGDKKIEINIPVNLENASMIQSVIRHLGREVIHTWSQQYSNNP